MTPSTLPDLDDDDDFATFLDTHLLQTNSDDELHSPQKNEERKRKHPETKDENEVDRKRKQVDAKDEDADECEDVGKTSIQECPPHPGVLRGASSDICYKCGVILPIDDHNFGVTLNYIHKGLVVTFQELDRIRHRELQKSLSNKKLHLVLDLDHTLLNSATYSEVTADEMLCLESYQEGLYNLGSMNMQMWTKLRPFVHQFLQSASKMFEMHLYTMGDTAYAQAIAKILDPEGIYFQDRIISTNESTCNNAKNLDIILAKESSVVILDDTLEVWPKHKANVVLIERYNFFQSSCRRFSISTGSLLETKKDESEHNGALAHVLGLLKRVHCAFFNGKYQDSGGVSRNYDGKKDILQSIKSNTLSGCKIVLTGVIPRSHTNPEEHPLWCLIENLGATCSDDLDLTVTHIVGTDIDTLKAKWAVENDRFLVHPKWVEAASYLWTRPPEQDFTIDKFPSITTLTNTDNQVPNSRSQNVTVT